MIGPICQVLHGYDRGHRLLVTSTELTPEERYRLDRLSDLSGYPGRNDPPPYLSGYPCGRYYVIARTWIDAEAERRGTVWTHSLLVPAIDVGGLIDMLIFDPIFRKPSKPVDLASYERDLEIPTLRPAPPDLRRHAANLAAWFGGEREPMVWVDADDFGEAELRALWWCLPEADRCVFTFCTHALLARYAGDRLFDWIVTTPEALRLFGEAASTVRIIRPEDADPLPTWIEPLVSKGPQVWGQVEARGFHPTLGQRKIALRYEELRSRSGIAALLGCVDLLRLLPGGGSDAEREDLVRAWLDTAPSGTPGDLGPILDLLAREPATIAPTLRDQLADRLWKEVRHASNATPAWQVKRLWSTGGSLRTPVRQALIDAAAELDFEALCGWLAEVIELAAPVVERLPADCRSALLEYLHQRMATDAASSILLGAVAAVCGDMGALLPLVTPGDSSMLEVAEAIHRSHPDTSTWTALLDRVGSDAVLTWWSRRPDASGAQELAGFLATKKGLESLVDNLECAPHVRIAVLSEASPSNLAHVLAERPNRLRALWMEMQQEPDAPTTSFLALAVRHACDGDTLLSMVDVANLSGLADHAWATSLLDMLTGPLVRRALSCGDAAAFDALAKPWAEHRLGRLGHEDWSWIAKSANIPDAARWLASPGARRAREDTTRVENVVRSWSQRPWDAVDTVPALQALLRALPHSAKLSSSALLLDRCLREPTPECVPLVASTFPVVHRGMCSDRDRYPLLRLVERWLDRDWDKAKHLRRALMGTWVRESWPPTVLLDASRDDPELWDYLVDLLTESPPNAVARLLSHLRATDASRYDSLPSRLRKMG